MATTTAEFKEVAQAVDLALRVASSNAVEVTDLRVATEVEPVSDAVVMRDPAGVASGEAAQSVGVALAGAVPRVAAVAGSPATTVPSMRTCCSTGTRQV